MRILYFSRDYGFYTTTFIRNEVEYFAQKYPVKYLCQKSYLKNEPDFLNVVRYQQPLLKKLLWKTGLAANFYSSSYSVEINKLITGFNPTVIHCHFGVEALMLIDNIDFKRYPIIIHFHGYDASQALNNNAYVKKLKRIFQFKNITPVTCNKFFADKLSKVLNISRDRFFVLNYGIDISFFQRKPIQKNNYKTFIQISSLAVKKGHEYTLQAFGLFLSKTKYDCRLIIAGDGPRKSSLQKLANSLNIDDKVQFIGSITPAKAIELLSTADVFVHHSITAPNGDMEGMPNAILEAMAMELPVVSTCHSGIPELVEDGVNGFLVKEKDIHGYAKAMQKAVEAGLTSLNRHKIEKSFNLSSHNRLLDVIYSKIANFTTKNQ